MNGVSGLFVSSLIRLVGAGGKVQSIRAHVCAAESVYVRTFRAWKEIVCTRDGGEGD